MCEFVVELKGVFGGKLYILCSNVNLVFVFLVIYGVFWIKLVVFLLIKFVSFIGKVKFFI